MKKILRTAAALLAAVMLVSCCAMSVFAESEAGDWSDEDTAELMEYLEQTGNDELLQSYIDAASGTDVSGTDASGTDVIGTTESKKLRDYALTEKQFKEYGLELMVPDLAMYADVYSNTEELSAALNTMATPDSLFNISYSGFSNYIVYAMSNDSNNMMALTYTESAWARFIGSYDKLSAEEQESLAAQTDLLGMGAGSASFRVINGVPMLCQEYFDQITSTMVYVVQTIVNGGIYEMYIQVSEPGDADFDVAESIINSLKISGVSTQRYGVAGTNATNWLFALVAVLFVIVALLVFFLVRFSAFAKAAGSEFNVIGFNFPEKEEDEDDDEDQ